MVIVNQSLSIWPMNHFCTSLFFVSKDSKSTTEPDSGIKSTIPKTLDEFLVSITPSVPWSGNVHWVLLNCQMPPLFFSLKSLVKVHNWSENTWQKKVLHIFNYITALEFQQLWCAVIRWRLYGRWQFRFHWNSTCIIVYDKTM